MKSRDNKWLLLNCSLIWSNHFADIKPKNKVRIKFSRDSRYRFGSIRLDPQTKVSTILINAKFKDDSVPEKVVLHTIAHELSHYVHGFSSPLKKLHAHPHRGGVIDNELKKRGLGELIIAYKSWLRAYRKSCR